MTSRDRIRTVLEGGIPDRVPMHDGYWEETLKRWQEEGLPGDVANDPDLLHDYFGNEIRMLPIDPTFRLKERVIQEDDRYYIKITRDGAKFKYLKHSTSTPGLIDFPVDSPDRWYELKQRLKPTLERLPKDFQARLTRYRSDGRFVVVSMHDPYEATWLKVGPTRLLESLKTDVELVHDIFKTITDLNIGVCEELLGKGYEIDGAWIWGDIAYSRGIFFSISTYKEVLYPYHKRLIGFFVSRKIPVIYHTDGNVKEALPLLVEAGISCLQPLEAKAGMDLFELKKAYGERLTFMGNVDYERIARGRHEACEEIKLKVGLGKEGGRYIYHSDHSVPPKISLSLYKYVLELVRRYGQY